MAWGQVKDKPQSMLAAKSFEATSDREAIARWFGILAEELASRMASDFELHQRRPRTFVVHYRCVHFLPACRVNVQGRERLSSVHQAYGPIVRAGDRAERGRKGKNAVSVLACRLNSC